MGMIRDLTPNASAISAVIRLSDIAVAHPLGAVKMSGEVAIAEGEPRLAVETRERAEHVERFSVQAPSLRATDYARERVGDGVDIG